MANLSLAASKSAQLSAQTPSFAPTGPSNTSEGQKRAGGSGTFGAGSSTRAGPSPRNKQAARNQNKQTRRYRQLDEDAYPVESVAMRDTGGRKGQNITHLMNFSLPPRQSQYQQYDSFNRRPIRRTWGMGSGYHAVDKARYVHANYRFIVDPHQDYHAQTFDADVYLDWNNVQQILASPISQDSSCPICLGEPVAPRMAKCGHIYCLPCLIRYMHSTDDSTRPQEKRARWKDCAICHDSIYISDTRPVRWYAGQEGPAPRENEDIVLRLVKRPAGSTLALPRDSYTIARSDEIPWHFAVDAMDFARIMLGSEDYMTAQFNAEIEALKELERHDELMFGEDNEWTMKAIRSIGEAKEKVKGLGNPAPAASKPEKRKEADSTPSLRFEAPASPTSALSTSIAEFRAQAGITPGPSDYFFYQALQHHYLYPLDIRILKAAFVDFGSFPSTILPRIERISTGHIVDDELRKRNKYLSHLPYGCEVAFLECDWTDTVPPEILANFAPEITKRRQKYADKSAREEKERVRAEKEEEDKRYSSARRSRPSDVNMPDRFQPDDFAPLPPQVAGSYEGGSGYESTSPMWGATGNGKQKGSAFASLGSPGTSPNTARTVWGTTMRAHGSPGLLAAQDVAPVEDGWLAGWEKDLMLHDDNDVLAQVEAMSLAGAGLEPGESSSSAAAAQAPVSNGGKGKKKGKKGITVFSTGGRRGL